MHKLNQSTKSRKLRKGTLSCWACKRRKVRCVFAPSQTVCNNCRSRHGQCVLQDVPDPGILSSNGENNTLDGRLSHLEAVAYRSNLEPTEVGRETLRQQTRRREPFLGLPTASTSTEIDKTSVKGDLLLLWPSEQVMDIIKDMPRARYTVALKNITSQPRPLPRAVHNDETTLANIAFDLLFLANLIQSASPSEQKRFSQAGIECRRWPSDVVDVVSRTFLSDHRLATTKEVLECLLMETVFYNSSGDLEKACLSVRRAVTVAQLNGVHRGSKSSAAESSGAKSSTAELIWFRIVQFDNYLSMVLGVPPGIVDDTVINTPALESDGTDDQFDQALCLAGALFLKRQYKSFDNSLSQTDDIDKILRAAALAMSPQWWLMPSASALSTQDDTRGLGGGVRRMMSQLTYYHLMVNLHLSCLVISGCNRVDSTNKAAIVDASRQLLARVTACHEIPSIASYCRGIDYLALTASTALCIARAGDLSGSIAHQNQSDRGLLERISQIMHGLAEVSDDKIATEVGFAMNHLLVVDDDSRAGVPWSVELQPASREGKVGYGIAISENDKEVLVSLPPTTTVRFLAAVPEVSVSRAWPDIPEATDEATFSAEQDSFCWMPSSEKPSLDSSALFHDLFSFDVTWNAMGEQSEE